MLWVSMGKQKHTLSITLGVKCSPHSVFPDPGLFPDVTFGGRQWKWDTGLHLLTSKPEQKWGEAGDLKTAAMIRGIAPIKNSVS